MEPRYLQPYFLSFNAAFLGVWALVNTILYPTVTHSVVSIWSFILISISSFSIFVLWRYNKNNEKVLFFGSYIFWFFISPIIWLAIHWGMIYIYAFIYTECCEYNYYFDSVWYEVIALPDSNLSTMIFVILLLYVSIWLTKNIKESKSLIRASFGISIFSVIVFILGIFILYV